jgi:hypothetical protein
LIFDVADDFKADFFPNHIAQTNLARARKRFRAVVQIFVVQIINRDDDVFRFEIGFDFFEQLTRDESFVFLQCIRFARFFRFDEIVCDVGDVSVVDVNFDVEIYRQSVVFSAQLARAFAANTDLSI